MRGQILTGLAALGLCAALVVAQAVDAPTPAMNEAGCADAGPRTRDFLPQFPAAGTRTIVNPCLGLGDLAGSIAELIPPAQRDTVKPFVAGVGSLVKKVLAINSLAECGYQTDRLALGIYQDRTNLWSVGVVAVTRGRVDAVVETSVCFLLDQIPFLPGNKLRSDGPVQPQPTYCVQAQRRHRAGQGYTVLWLGSSDVMCQGIGLQLSAGSVAGSGVTATVKASPAVNVRAGASTAGAPIRVEAAGRTVVVTCYRIGQTITTRRGASDRWYRLKTEDGEQYITGAWLDTGDRPELPARCG